MIKNERYDKIRRNKKQKTKILKLHLNAEDLTVFSLLFNITHSLTLSQFTNKKQQAHHFPSSSSSSIKLFTTFSAFIDII